MVGHVTVRALLMEGDPTPSATVEWVIRLFLIVLAVTAVWTVFGDEIGQFLGR